MMKRYPKIIYFIKDAMPSQDVWALAEEFGPNTVFRNANFVPSSGSLEECDGVGGDVPEAYKNLPSAKEALEKFKQESKPIIAEQPKEQAKSPSVVKNNKTVEWKPNA